jgi:hypothetical protein
VKRVIAITTSAIMAAGATLASPVVAQNRGPASNVVEFCAAFGNTISGPGLPTPGSCVSYFRAGGAVSFCKEAKDFGVLESYGFRSQGECIVALS